MKVKEIYSKIVLFVFILIDATVLCAKAQIPVENTLKLSGKLYVDERFLLKGNNWAWNETRLTLNLDKKLPGNSTFKSEVWLRNMGLPKPLRSADMYNKGIVDPYNFEIREASVLLNGFISEKLDVTIGRQRIVWGTADKLNPTDNLNPADLEDILDFGRRRGSDAINLNYYFNNHLSAQLVYIPFFQTANLPVGIFSNVLNPNYQLPKGMLLKKTSDTLLMPRYNIKESATLGLKCKGFAGGVDFSISYINGTDGLPVVTKNTLIPVDATGGVNVISQLSFVRNHIVGADLATSIGGAGFWTEAALFITEKNIILTNDLSALFPFSQIPVIQDSIILNKTKPYLKFIVGGDYFFARDIYLNVQYMHGFMHERGTKNLNDYFFVQLEKSFLNNKLRIAPLGGALIVGDWKSTSENFALVYMPEISFQPTPNAEICLSSVFFEGKGDNLFARLNQYNMLNFKLIYNF